MTKVYCCNFMEQIYQWFEYRKKLVGPFRLSYKTVVKDDWKEQEPEAELSVKHLKLSIAHYFKLVTTFVTCDQLQRYVSSL